MTGLAGEPLPGLICMLLGVAAIVFRSRWARSTIDLQQEFLRSLGIRTTPLSQDLMEDASILCGLFFAVFGVLILCRVIQLNG